MKLLVTIFLTFTLLTACGRQTERETSYNENVQSSQSCSTHAIGQAFASDDGCNTCSCNSSGQMSCTMMACGNLPGLDLSQYQ